MSDIKLSDLLKALPSVFFMSENAIVGLDEGHSLRLTTELDGMLIQRLVHKYDYGDEPCSNRLGRFSLREFLELVTQLYEKDSNTFARTSRRMESPSELIDAKDASIWIEHHGSCHASLRYVNQQMIDLPRVTKQTQDDRPKMPQIKCDRLTISSEDSAWNHFKMCANVVSSVENGVVNLIASDRNSIEIHASSDHEEYRAEIPLIGGEPPSDDQGIGIPVALINEVSYWMETGLHTESHLDIWFDQNHVKIGTKTNHVFSKIEEYQSQKFDWTQKSNVKPKELGTEGLTNLVCHLTEFVKTNKEEFFTVFAPLVDLCVENGNFSIQPNLYERHEKVVSIGIAELTAFHSFIDLAQDSEELCVKIEVNPAENHVIFSGETFCHDAGITIPFTYLILGAIPNIEDEVSILGHYRTDNSSPFFEEEVVCEWENPCTLNYEGVTFIERYPPNLFSLASEHQSSIWESLAKQEDPTLVLRRKATELIREIDATRSGYSLYINDLIDEDELFTTNSPINEHGKPADINDLFEAIDPIAFEDYACLEESQYKLSNALTLTCETKMFDPTGTQKAIKLLEEAIHNTKWTYFRFQNKHIWEDAPHIWQQTFGC